MSEQCRYFLELAFNGTPYHGWQIQPNAITVQAILDKALSTICRQQVETLGCGRTDTGVHATQFYAHFDVPQAFDIMNSNVLNSLNAVLPYEIAARRFIEVSPEAHARFDATMRSYQYHIHFEKDPFKQQFSWLLPNRPDIELMNKAAAIIKEYKDFSCFSKSNTQVFTNNCFISRAEWIQSGSACTFHISADRFLRNMVRAIVGTLLRVGQKEINPEDIREIIESKNRSRAGVSVPACGLYLTEVIYPYIKTSANG
jgi:tRNA pseudouridine38-40 synthase